LRSLSPGSSSERGFPLSSHPTGRLIYGDKVCDVAITR
jgi:hypothetical protein